MRIRKKQAQGRGKPSVKKFSVGHPCTKLDLWNCFRGRRGFIRRQVDIAYAIVGKNAPRYLLREGYAEQFEIRNVEYIKLTGSGEEWLFNKFKRLLPKHPEWTERAANLPSSMVA